MTISFVVPGIPRPQGSKTAMPRRGGGRPLMVDANPKSKPWMAAVTAEAAAVMRDRELLCGPLSLRAVFIFPRPKSHFRSGKKSHVLRENAPEHHDKKPDVDKLLRAIGDSMTGIVYHDDAQICNVGTTKSYGVPAGVAIVVSELPQDASNDNRTATQNR